jgi:hypothetical protein
MRWNTHKNTQARERERERERERVCAAQLTCYIFRFFLYIDSKQNVHAASCVQAIMAQDLGVQTTSRHPQHVYMTTTYVMGSCTLTTQLTPIEKAKRLESK